MDFLSIRDSIRAASSESLRSNPNQEGDNLSYLALEAILERTEAKYKVPLCNHAIWGVALLVYIMCPNHVQGGGNFNQSTVVNNPGGYHQLLALTHANN